MALTSPNIMSDAAGWEVDVVTAVTDKSQQGGKTCLARAAAALPQQQQQPPPGPARALTAAQQPRASAARMMMPPPGSVAAPRRYLDADPALLRPLGGMGVVSPVGSEKVLLL